MSYFTSSDAKALWLTLLLALLVVVLGITLAPRG